MGGLTGTVFAQRMAAPRAAREAVEMQQAGVAQGEVATTVALVVVAPRQAAAQGKAAPRVGPAAEVGARALAAAATPGRIVAPRAAVAATDPVVATAGPEKAGALAAPVVRAMAAMGGAVTRLGMTKVGLVVETPAAG